LVPNQAIEADREAGRYYVIVQKPDGTTERLEVQIGLRDGSKTQIVEGLSEGDLVILPKLPEQIQTERAFGPGAQGGGGFGGGGGH
jgi:multidrug efflux pump subunit AcrA (membrane-fusion protein)